jgi:hypothetical protein
LRLARRLDRIEVELRLLRLNVVAMRDSLITQRRGANDMSTQNIDVTDEPTEADDTEAGADQPTKGDDTGAGQPAEVDPSPDTEAEAV